MPRTQSLVGRIGFLSAVCLIIGSAIFATTSDVLGRTDEHLALKRLAVGSITNFGPNLRAVCPQPEGIAVAPDGTLYASSLALTIGPTGVTSAAQTAICVIDSQGSLIDSLPITAGPSGKVALTGMLFIPGHGLYVADAADGFERPTTAGRLLRVDPHTKNVTVVATGFGGTQAMIQDRFGSLYLADGGTPGRIFKLQPDGSNLAIWAENSLLSPAPGGLVGANGLALDPAERNLYVTNPTTNRILRLPIRRDGRAGKIEVFADGHTIDARQQTTQALEGVDGIQIDVMGNIYVLADFINELQVLSPRGTLIGRYQGSQFNALGSPSSLVFHDKKLYISNHDFYSALSGDNSKLSVVDVPFAGLPISH